MTPILFILGPSGVGKSYVSKELQKSGFLSANFFGLVSHGSNLSFHESPIDNSVPVTISATTDQRFNANESVLVLAGSRVLVSTVIDDMHAKVNAVLWWQLQKLCIKTAEDVFT